MDCTFSLISYIIIIICIIISITTSNEKCVFCHDRFNLSESWILLYVYIVEDVGYMAIFEFYCMFFIY